MTAATSPEATRRRWSEHARPMPQVDGAEHRWIEIRSGTDRAVRLHLAEFGAGEPVLLLHGFAQHWYAWRKVAPLLAGEYRLICLDLRGFGWSQQTKKGYDIENLAADVLAALDELGLARVRVIGHEWGALVAFRLCLRAPDRVAAFLAVNGSHPWPRHRSVLPNLWRMWFTAFVEYPVLGRLVLRHWPAFTRFLLRHGVADPAQWAEEELTEFVSATQHSAHAGQSLMWQYVLHDIPALALGSFRKARLTVPTTILGGAKDPTLPPSLLAGGERNADDLKVEIAADYGHHLPDEAPEWVAQHARELFARVN